MTTLNESVWNPVDLNKAQASYNITSYTVSSNWYNRVLDNSGDRYNRLMKYNEADCDSVEISRALDIIAEDVSSVNADNQEVFRLDYPDDSKIKKTTIGVMNAMLEVWEKRTEFDMEFFDRVRLTLKFGATFFRKNTDGTVTYLPTERFVGYILSEEDENIVTHYLYDPNLTRFDKRDNTFIKKYNKTTGQQQNYDVIPVDKLLIFKVGDGPFGCSLISKVYRVWKQMSMLEDAVLIYRVVRAPERRIYYIDVGNLQGPKREAAIEKQRMRLMQKRVSKGGSIEGEYDASSMGEDMFIPTNSNGKGSRIETLPGGQQLGEITDLEWFAKKMAAGLRVPNSMTDMNSVQEQNQFSDMRIGQMYQIEMRYMGYVKRMKMRMQKELEKNFVEFCENRDVIVPQGMELIVNDSMSFAMYKEMELNQTLLNVFNSTLQIGSLSKKYSLQKFMNMDNEEIRDNEYNKLREKGLSDEEIKELPENVVDNIVYGDGRLGADYGIKTEEGGGGFF